MDQLHSQLGSEGFFRFRSAVVQVLERVYSTASRDHDAGQGDDAITFGVRVWRHSYHQLGGKFQVLDDATVESPQGSFRIVFRGLKFRVL